MMRAVGLLLIAVGAGTAPAAAQVFYTLSGPEQGAAGASEIERRPQPHRGWLLGTLHSAEPRLHDWPPVLAQALRSAELVALELRPDRETRAILEDAMLLPESQALDRLLPGGLGADAVQALVERGVPLDRARRMQPWAAALSLSQPPQPSSGPMDLALAQRAAEYGVELVALERVEEQLDFFRALGMDVHRQLLEVAIDSPQHIESQHQRMLALYLAGDLAGLRREADRQLRALGPDAAARFVDLGLLERNRRMLERALPLLERGLTLIAVGALHLPGDGGLIAGLRAAGYRVEPVY